MSDSKTSRRLGRGVFQACVTVVLVVLSWTRSASADPASGRPASAMLVASYAPGTRGLSNSPSIKESFEGFFLEASHRYALPVCFLRAIARVESGFDPTVMSIKGAMGLMQLMPKTARAMGVRHPYDARENILGGARYLRILANQWKGDMVLTVASYNAGPAAVTRCRCVPPYPETQGYVQRVLRHYQAYQRGLSLPQR